MENIDNELDGVQRDTKKLDVIKKQLLKTTDFLRTGYQNRQRKKVAPSMTDSEENEPGKRMATKNKTKLARKVAINIENFQPPAQIEDQDESSEDEDDWDSLSVSDFEYQDEELFCDVYHKCINIVGQDVNNEFGKNSIVSCLKAEFDFSEHTFETLIRSVGNRQNPKLILKVDVLKIKDILPKDIFSVGDLFYVIWSSSNPRTFYHGKITKGMLKPIKDQKFEIPISSGSGDILHVELRDFLPFENETDRKSQEHSQNNNLDESISEPIASAQIMLKDILSIGQTKWISLRRPLQNTCFGKLQLKISFGSNENVKIALERHRCLVKKFLLHLMTEKNNCLNDWKGNFCPEAELILKQHLIQSNLTYQDDLIAKWSGFTEMIRNNPVNFGIFDNLLDELLLSFEGNNLSKGKKKYFWNPARIMMSMCYNYIKTFRCRLNVSSQKEKLAQFHSVLSVLHDIAHCEKPPNLNLFPVEFYPWIEKTDNPTFQTVLHEFVVQAACDWFEFLVKDNWPGNDTDEAKLVQMINVTEQVILDLQDGMDFHGIFVKKQNFAYNKTIFIVYQAKITEMMEISIQKLCRGIKQLNIKECYRGNIDLNSFTLGTSMCTLFFKLQQFDKMGSEIFRNDDTFETFPMRRYHSWFSSAVIITWLDIAIVKAMRQIDEAVEMDDFTPVDSLNLHGSSAADMLKIIYQIRKFWVQLEWPDLEKCYSFLVKIIEDVFTVSIHYADLIINKISIVGEEKKNYSINHWCVAINNVDYISHKIQQFIVKLGVDELIHSLSDCKSMTAADRCRRSLTQMMNFSFEIMKQKTVDLLDTFSKEMDLSIERFLQEGAELLHQQPKVCDTLTIYLDENLVTLNSKLSSEIFHRLLDVIWERISNILFVLIEDGIEKNRPMTYFSNLKEAVHNLVGFFKIDEVLEDGRTKISEILARNERKLTIYGTETSDLIHMYFLERLQEQEALEVPEDGVLAVNLHTENDALIVEILNASNVIPMDSNGQSDPFVCVELIPLSKFSFFNYKTKVSKKTLYPMFGEKFTVTLTKSQFQVKDALIKFTVKDRDLLSKNRYMAEAFIRLNDAAGQCEPRLYNLTLNRPRNLENDILKCLEARRNHDRWAKIFLKKEKTRIRSTQEFRRFDV